MSEPPILLLADAHLRGRSDPRQAAMTRFLAAQQPRAGGLVVLGDLFDYLAGSNRAAADAYRPVLSLMARWAPYHFVEGNHDFDLSPVILPPAEATIHPVPVTLRLGNVPCHLFHGDRTSPRDVGTRLLRRTLQSRVLRFTRDRLLPDRLGFHLALGFATLSRRSSWPGRADEADYARLRAGYMVRDPAIGLAVFAHTHVPWLERVPGGIIANPGTAVPGGTYLQLTDQSISLHRFPDGALLTPGPLPIDVVNPTRGDSGTEPGPPPRPTDPE